MSKLSWGEMIVITRFSDEKVKSQVSLFTNKQQCLFINQSHDFMGWHGLKIDYYNEIVLFRLLKLKCTIWLRLKYIPLTAKEDKQESICHIQPHSEYLYMRIAFGCIYVISDLVFR